MRSERLGLENMPWGERRQGEGISVRHVVVWFRFLARSILDVRTSWKMFGRNLNSRGKANG